MKLTLLLFALLAFSPVAGLTQAAEANETAPATESNAEVELPAERVGLWPVWVKGKYGYINRSGEMVIQPRFLDGKDFHDGLAAVSVEIDGREKWGYIDRRGEFVIEPAYDFAQEYSEGLCCVGITEEGMEIWGGGYDDSGEQFYINLDGQREFDRSFSNASPFKNGLAVVKPDGSTPLCQVIDRESKVICSLDAEWISFIGENCLVFKKVGSGWLSAKYGVADLNGEILIEPTYDAMSNVEAGLVTTVVKHPGSGYDEDPTFTFKVINLEGETVIETGFELGAPLQGRIKAEDEDGWGFMDFDGNWVVEPVHDLVGEYSEGLALVLDDDTWSVIDLEGEVLGSWQFEYSDMFIWPDFEFHNGMASFSCGGLTGISAIIDTGGKAVWTGHVGMFNIEPFSDGLVCTEGDGLVIDKAGNVLLESEDLSPSKFSEGLAVVGKKIDETWESGEKTGETWKYGFIDPAGDWVIEPRFDHAKEFVDGLAPVQLGLKWGYINREGKVVAIPLYDEAFPLKEGMGRVRFRDKWGFVNARGEEAIPIKYERVQDFSQSLAAVRVDGLWGYISPKGIALIEPKFKDARPFTEGLAAVVEDTRWGYIDRLGSYRIEPDYWFASPFSDGLAGVATRDPSVEGYQPGRWWYKEEWPEPFLTYMEEDCDLFFIDKSGAKVIQSDQYTPNGPFNSGRALVRRYHPDAHENFYDFIDREGNLVTDAWFSLAWDFSEDRAWVTYPDFTAYVDSRGNVVWYPVFGADGSGARLNPE